MSNPVVFTPVQNSTQSVSVTATSAMSTAIGAAPAANSGLPQLEVVRLLSTVPVCVTFEETVGGGATATTAHMELPAGVPEYFEVLPGRRIAAIRAPSATADGTLKITRMQKRLG